MLKTGSDEIESRYDFSLESSPFDYETASSSTPLAIHVKDNWYIQTIAKTIAKNETKLLFCIIYYFRSGKYRISILK